MADRAEAAFPDKSRQPQKSLGGKKRVGKTGTSLNGSRQGDKPLEKRRIGKKSSSSPKVLRIARGGGGKKKKTAFRLWAQLFTAERGPAKLKMISLKWGTCTDEGVLL